MNKTVLIFTVLLLTGHIALAQKINPTTEAEFLYGSVGYKIQLNNKLPVKEGYSLKDFKPVVEENRQVEFKGVFRKGENTPCAVIMIYTKLRNAPQYYCIPTDDASADLWQRFNASLLDDSENQQPQLQFFAYCLAYLSSQNHQP